MNPSSYPSRAPSASPTRLPRSSSNPPSTEPTTSTIFSPSGPIASDPSSPTPQEDDVDKVQVPTYASVTATPSPAAIIPTDAGPARSHTLLDLPSHLESTQLSAGPETSTAIRSFTSPTPASASAHSVTGTASIASGTVSVSKLSNAKSKGGRKSGVHPLMGPDGGKGREKKMEREGKGRLILEKFDLYETKLKYYLIASNQSSSNQFRILKIDRTLPTSDSVELEVTEDLTTYSLEEITRLLATLGAGNTGGIQRVESGVYGLAGSFRPLPLTLSSPADQQFNLSATVPLVASGFIRFTSTYYMILIKSRTPVALLGGHYIYHCEETIMRPVSNLGGSGGGGKSAEETRLVNEFKGVDLSKNFYFSYTYDLSSTLQYNLTLPHFAPSSTSRTLDRQNEKWLWNHHLLLPARSLSSIPSSGGAGSLKSDWMLHLVHGFVDQAKLSVFGRTVYITLIARRSRFFAGARFLKRGVNDQGHVANDVETEQIVSEALTTPFYSPSPPSPPSSTPSGNTTNGTRRLNPRYTSFVQVRGSIPLYWCQESVNMSPKPPIELTIADPYYSAAALHFDDLLGRYGGPITILNLIKHKERAPRESKLLPEFRQCVDYLNQFLPKEGQLKYIAWDISAANKQRDKDVIGFLEDIAEEALESTKFFHSGPEPSGYQLHPEPGAPPYRDSPLLQSGVIRTNCIDCLDRTNAAQFVIAKAALGHQLLALGLIHHPVLPFDSDAVNLITEMHHDLGDTIALQYGGSHLVNTMETYRKIGQWTSHSRDMIENMKRYYANSFIDADKQAAIDLFLGVDSNLPSNPPTGAPRSYREWYTPSHLSPTLTSEDLAKRLAEPIAADDNYWQAYYRPKLFTEFGRHFAFKVNSTEKYLAGTGLLGAVAANNTETFDPSPFVPRLAAQPTPKIVGGVRRWISHRNPAQTKALLRARIQSQRIDETPPTTLPILLPSSTEALAKRHLIPSIEIEEAKEYEAYIAQFQNLTLTNDLSERDSTLYIASAEYSKGRGEFKVEKGNVAIYGEAVKVAGGVVTNAD